MHGEPIRFSVASSARSRLTCHLQSFSSPPCSAGCQAQNIPHKSRPPSFSSPSVSNTLPDQLFRGTPFESFRGHPFEVFRSIPFQTYCGPAFQLFCSTPVRIVSRHSVRTGYPSALASVRIVRTSASAPGVLGGHSVLPLRDFALRAPPATYTERSDLTLPRVAQASWLRGVGSTPSHVVETFFCGSLHHIQERVRTEVHLCGFANIATGAGFPPPSKNSGFSYQRFPRSPRSPRSPPRPPPPPRPPCPPRPPP